MTIPHQTHRPTRTRRTVGIVLVGAVLIAGGCSDNTGADTATASETATAGDPVAFCEAGETINAKTSAIASPEQAVEVFTDLDPTLDTMLSTAPAAVGDAAETFVSTARASVRSGDFTPFEDGTIDALVAQFDAVCAPG